MLEPAFKLSLVWALVGAALVAVVCEQVPESSYKVRISRDELLKKLAVPDLSPSDVMGLLSRTTYKKQKNAIAEKFQVQHILDLAQVDRMDRCTTNEVQRRQNICNQLNHIVNLKRFCEHQLEQFKNNCKKYQMSSLYTCLDKLRLHDRKRLEELHSKMVLGTSQELSETDILQVVVYLNGKTSTYKQRLRTSCLRLNEQLAKYLFTDEFLTAIPMVRSCRAIEQVVTLEASKYHFWTN